MSKVMRMNKIMDVNKILFCIFLLMILAATLFAQGSEQDALLAFREGRFEDAIRITTNELRAAPNNMNSYAVQGWALLSLGRWTEAVDSAQRGLAASRYDHRIIAIMAEAQYGLGNYLSALQYMQDYAAVRPNGSIINYMYLLMGEVHIRFEEYHLADIALSASLHFDASNAKTWERLGFAREQAGDIPYAIEAYQRALELNSGLEQSQAAISRLAGN